MMLPHTREAIAAAYEARYERDRIHRKPQGADGDAIAEEIAAQFGVTAAEVSQAVLDDAARVRGAG